ncbi:hypothetical protein BC832DRAFT_588735 [Gaertneriomyces semiglobifer]|nr:hypothetical protein BC832DRAFT_588735 [Gaertneriomyces semiglobifer]
MAEQQQQGELLATDSLYNEFLSYPWDTDERFQAGMKSILTKEYPNPRMKENDILKAKCFYFSKFEKPIDLDGFLSWRGAQPGGNNGSQAERSATSSVSKVAREDHTDAVVEQPKPSEPQYPRSFQELCEMVAKGEEIPGIRTIPNKINEESPSQSVLRPRKKPWEKEEVEGTPTQT